MRLRQIWKQLFGQSVLESRSELIFVRVQTHVSQDPKICLCLAGFPKWTKNEEAAIFCCMVNLKLRIRKVAIPFLNWKVVLPSSFLLVLICDNDDTEPATNQKVFQILAFSSAGVA